MHIRAAVGRVQATPLRFLAEARVTRNILHPFITVTSGRESTGWKEKFADEFYTFDLMDIYGKNLILILNFKISLFFCILLIFFFFFFIFC